MREARATQMSLFDFYAKHQIGEQLRRISDYLDSNPELLDSVLQNLKNENVKSTGWRQYFT